MDLQAFRKEYPEYDDMDNASLAEALHKSMFSDIPREHFDAVFLGGQEEQPQEEPPAPQLEYTSNRVPLDPNRLHFEVGLVKNKNTSKTAVLLPEETTAQQALAISKVAKLPVIKEGEAYYLFDPKQITERTLRGQIRSGKNGQALGYGTDSVPENGVPYAVDLDGHGSLNPQEIVDLQQSGRLGFSGMAPDQDMAMAKIREMGRDDAEIRGINS